MKDWSQEELDQIWEKATPVKDYDKNRYRKDQCGAWIERDKYGPASKGELHTSFTWQVDHITPVSKGGKDIISNVRPLQWYNNECKSNGWLKKGATADGDHNVEKKD